MRHISHSTYVPKGFKTDQEFQGYLQISQNARTASLLARREAIDAFWTGVGRALQRMLHCAGTKVARDHQATAIHTTET